MKLSRFVVSLLVATLLVAAGCAGKDNAAPAPTKTVAAVATSEFEDYDDEHIEVVSDPLEPWNRFWFGFNDIMTLKVIKPTYAGYTYVTPSFVRTGLSNVLYNFEAPYRMLSRLLQGELGMAGVEFGRFMANSMAGFGGLINVAAKDKPLVPFLEDGADLNQTFAVWGLPDGPYLVWPFLGPNTLRSSVGLGGKYFSSLFFWGVEPVGPVNLWTGIGVETGLRFNDMGSLIDNYEALTKSAVEPYSAMRDAYIKYQRAQTEKLRTLHAQ